MNSKLGTSVPVPRRSDGREGARSRVGARSDKIIDKRGRKVEEK